MNPQTYTLSDLPKKGKAAEAVFQAPEGWVCDIHPPKRTLSQNALIHKWFGEIATQTNESVDEVKLDCKGYQGVPMLLAEDQEFAEFYEKFRAMYPDAEQRRKALKWVPVTSIMTTSQLGRFADAVFREYSQQGIRLTVPEDQK